MLMISGNYASTKAFQSKPIIINGKKFVPKSEFKGPILKLTAEEKSKIDELLKKISDLEIRLIKLDELSKNKHISYNERVFFDNQYVFVESSLNILKREIETIKSQRYQQQLSEASQKG